jgi:concentrative nucleoside transporter, CNT family
MDYKTLPVLLLVLKHDFCAGCSYRIAEAASIPPQNFVTASVMSISVGIAVGEMRMPEHDEPATRGHIVVDRGEAQGMDARMNALHAFSKGAVLELIVVGQILCVLSLSSFLPLRLTMVLCT